MDVAAQIMDLTTSRALLGAGDGGFGALQLLMVAGGVLGLGIVMRSTFRRVSRSARQPRTIARKMYADLTEETATRRDVEHVMVELDQLARQIHGRIDTRFAKLESVIHDADERINKLSHLLRETAGRSPLDLTVGEEVPIDRSDSDPPTSTVQAPRSNDTDDRHVGIYRLADAGLSANQIAEKVGQTAGEVELILALRRTKRDAADATGVVGSSPSVSAG
ncbi:MAG: hypothetical protein ACYTFA_03155 [Planctomycetota bacterium]|jgi:hypothetical protein